MLVNTASTTSGFQHVLFLKGGRPHRCRYANERESAESMKSCGRGGRFVENRVVTVLKVATCQFPVSADVEQNAGWVIAQMEEAARLGARVAHFPEGALSGYAAGGL